ncbi:hypothetical protein [Deinococcus murrayi]|uniref:hypothetical protein n=1 Tax=Deinococcus murrayi TaxID=68910 RepID=UPI000482790E|nr:hypothetical protein [Deinococcus murrayi]
MTLALRSAVAAALPSEEGLVRQLAALSPRAWTEVAEVFARDLPELEAALALPGAETLAQALGRLRGLSVLELGPAGRLPERAGGPVLGDAVLVTQHLTDGLAELEALLRAEAANLRVRAVAVAVERTNARGRTRLELQGVRVLSAVALADTPAGLKFEQRLPPRLRRAS